jgi:hypothetical protein
VGIHLRTCPFFRLEKAIMNELPFDFEVPVTFFEKSGPEGKQRRIGGIITTDNPDRHSEVILQRGLDFSSFLSSGWFNDNHSRETDGIVGYPEAVQYFSKGEVLPNGQRAKANGHWAEGYLLSTKKAEKIWELGKALQDTGRHLGFSVEGSIQKRTGRLRKTIAKARVRNVAITNCPVNEDSKLDILAKSLRAVEESNPSLLEKALGMGTATPGQAPVGPKTGMGAGQVLATESLEQDGQIRIINEPKPKKDEEEETKKSMTPEQAFAWVRERKPHWGEAVIGRFLEATKLLKKKGQ